MTDNKKLTLTEKIWTIQNELKSLVKDELNKFQNYKYFDENQVLKQLKPLLEKYRITLLISDDDSQPFTHEREGTNHFVKYLKQMKISDFETQAYQVYKFWACGSNTDLAKAKGSAETYAMKYILSKFFLIRILDENDPELKKPSETDLANRPLTEEEKKQVNEVLARHRLKEMNSSYGK